MKKRGRGDSINWDSFFRRVEEWRSIEREAKEKSESDEIKRQGLLMSKGIWVVDV